MSKNLSISEEIKNETVRQGDECQCCKKLGILDIVRGLAENDLKRDIRKANRVCAAQKK